jgi:RluA family pseudouridine synthase
VGERTLSPDHAAFARSLVIHADKALMVFDKPPGLASQGGSGVDISLDDLMAAFATPKGRVPRLIHRLDRETSGVIIAGRTKPATAELSQAFASRATQKTYLAIVCGGQMQAPEGMIDQPLHKSTRPGALDLMRPCPPDHPGAQAAITHYKTLASTPAAALVAFFPQTGRMHQLRAHAAHIGHPIAGDAKYGGLFSLVGVAIPRLMLHAARLSVPHPLGGQATYTAPAPADLIAACEALGLPLANNWHDPASEG